MYIPSEVVWLSSKSRLSNVRSSLILLYRVHVFFLFVCRCCFLTVIFYDMGRFDDKLRLSVHLRKGLFVFVFLK